MTSVDVAVTGPFDLALSMRASARFLAEDAEPDVAYRVAVRGPDGAPVAVTVRHDASDPAMLEATAEVADSRWLARTAAWLMAAETDLRPFYRLATGDPMLAPACERLFGVKMLRPASLFEMAVVAVTEQQISVAAAQRIRRRLIEGFGDRVDGMWAFPTPAALAAASPDDLRRVGLSRPKADYISGLAHAVEDGFVDLEALRSASDDEVRATVTALRGFGSWSAEYLLVRGLGRADAAAVDDLGIRKVLGAMRGVGRLSVKAVAAALAPYAPYRGFAMFYLMADRRLFPDREAGA